MISFLLELTELRDCYDNSVKAEYNENLEQITLILAPNVEKECDLSDEVLVEITFYDNLLPIKHVQDRFSFGTTTKIVMKNVKIADASGVGQKPITGYLNISTLYSYYYTEISQISHQISEFDECFDESKSFFSPELSSYFFEVYLTTACEQQVREAETYELTFGSESRNVINDNSVCTFDSQTRIYRCEEQVDYQEELQVPFSAARLVFNIEILGIEYTSEITFSDIRKGRISGLFDNLKLYVFENNAFIRGPINNEEEEKLLRIIQNNYDTIIYRLNILNISTHEQIELSEEREEYIEQRRMFEFICADKQCLRNLKIISNNLSGYDFDLDITFIRNEEITVYLQLDLEKEETCIQKAIAGMVNFHKECTQLFIRNSDECRPLKEKTNLVTKIVTPHRGQQAVVEEFTQLFDFSSTMYCCDCVEECYGATDPETGILIEYEQSGKQPQVGYVVSFALYNYSAVEIATCVVGGVIIALCLVDTIIKCIVMSRLIKNEKQKKHKV